jgi:hypothetical protein
VEEVKNLSAISFLFFFHSLTNFFNHNGFQKIFLGLHKLFRKPLSFLENAFLCHVHFMLLSNSYNAIFLISLNTSLYHEQNKLFFIWLHLPEAMLWLYFLSSVRRGGRIGEKSVTLLLPKKTDRCSTP